MNYREMFAESFRTNTGSCNGECNCGKVYYNPDEGWDWFEGELEQLEKGGIDIDEPVSFIEFEGAIYVYQCDCWHERAERIANFLYAHREGIGRFFKAIKIMKEIEAASIPDINMEET